MAVPPFVAETNTGHVGAAANVVCTLPAGAVAGHLWVVWGSFGGNATIGDPGGFTLVEDRTGGSSNANCHVRVMQKVVDQNDIDTSATATFTVSTAVSVGGSLLYSGVDQTTPINVATGQTNASSTNIPAPAVTTTAADCRLVRFYGQRLSNATGTITKPAAETQRTHVANTSGARRSAVLGSDKELGAAGDTGTDTATSLDTDTSVSITFAIAPVAGGPTMAYARPDGTITNSDGWLTDTGSSTNIYQAIDETTASDTDYIKSPDGA